jgi:hypothetical protein
MNLFEVNYQRSINKLEKHWRWRKLGRIFKISWISQKLTMPIFESNLNLFLEVALKLFPYSNRIYKKKMSDETD